MNSTTLKPLPGPSPLAALRGLRQSGFLANIGQLWHAYGDTFQLRLGPRTLIFAIHPDAVRHINITHRQNYQKLKSYDTVRRYLVGEGLVASTGELWRRQRKLMSPFFTPRGVQAYADIMLRDGVRLLERWDNLARSGQTVEIGEEMTLVTASIILKAMFSTETDEAIVKMKDAVETMVGFINSRQAGARLPVWLTTPANRKYSAARDKVHSYINALIAQLLADPTRCHLELLFLPGQGSIHTDQPGQPRLPGDQRHPIAPVFVLLRSAQHRIGPMQVLFGKPIPVIDRKAPQIALPTGYRLRRFFADPSQPDHLG
jgi:cytochrome P450